MANEEKMVAVDLRRSIGQRLPGGGGPRTLYGPGKGVMVPESLARSLGKLPVRVDEERAVRIAENTLVAGTPPGTPTDRTSTEDEATHQEVDTPEAVRRERMTPTGRTALPGTDVGSTEGTGGTGEPDPYNGWSKDDFRREAEARGLTVQRLDGRTDLDPRLEDYEAALLDDDRREAEDEGGAA